MTLLANSMNGTFVVVDNMKTKYEIFHKRRMISNTRLQMNNSLIERFSKMKFLVLTIDDKLTLTDHTDLLANEINSAYYAIVNLPIILKTSN